jgi:hypothetical protein
MTLNYWMMMEKYPNLKEEVGTLIPGREISLLLDKKLARWPTASCALVLACRPCVLKKKKKKKLGANFEMNWLSLKKNRFKFKVLGKLPVRLEEFMDYSSI